MKLTNVKKAGELTDKMPLKRVVDDPFVMIPKDMRDEYEFQPRKPEKYSIGS